METMEEKEVAPYSLRARVKSYPKFVFVLTFIAGIGGFLFGYDTGVISGAILYIRQDFGLTSAEEELIVSGAIIGAIFGSMASGMINTYVGRKKSILIACAVFTVGAFVMAFSPGKWVLFAGRIIVGLGVGLASMTVPVYISECAPEELRGALVSIDVLLITTGQFVSYCVDAVFLHVPYNWRWMLGLSAVPAILQFAGMIFMPESPRWLIERDHVESATKILIRARGNEERAMKEVNIIKEAVVDEREQLGGRNVYLELFRVPSLFHALVLGVGLQIFQQLSGINTVMYYSPTILKFNGSGDLTEDEANAQAIYASIAVAGTNMIMSVVAVALIDRVGRRPLLLISIAGASASLLVLAASFMLETSMAQWVSLAGLVSYLVFFAPGMGPIPWAYNSEIYPLYVRSAGNSISSCANWCANLIVSVTFLTLLNLLTPTGTFLLFFDITLVAFLFVILLILETKGLSLEDVQKLFESKWLAL